jgi:hypothetical protein
MSNIARSAAGDGGSRHCIGSGQNHAADSTKCRNIAQQATLLSLDSIVIGERHRKDIGEIAGRAANITALFEKLSPAPRYFELFSHSGPRERWDMHGDEVGDYPAWWAEVGQ